MKNEKQALVPRLRFPEFREAGEWDFRELEDACEVNPSNSALPESFVYTHQLHKFRPAFA